MYGRGYQGGGGGGGIGFGPPVTPPVVKQLLIANLAIFVFQVMSGSGFTGSLAATPVDFWQRGFLWQPFTYMFLHGGLGHIAGNMFCLWMFGSPLAMVWGAKRFLRFYLICGLGAGLIIVSWPYVPVMMGSMHPMQLAIPTLGASGAVFGVLLAYSLTWPDRTIMLIFPPVAFRAIWLIPLLFFMEYYFGPPNVSHIGHLGGVLVGWIYLRRQGEAGRLSLEQLKYRWRRYRMRKRLRAVQTEERQRDRQGPWVH